LENAVFEPQHPAWFLGRDELAKSLEKATEGILTPQQALDEVAVKLEKLVKEEEKKGKL